MTHGGEPGSETHQDSVVLTYLEGLLMHPVAGRPGATTTRRCEAGQGNPEQSNKATSTVQQPNHGTEQEDQRALPSAATQHLRKARLLRPEAFSELASAGSLSGESRDGSPQGESTVLASLLQSFSSRLQTAAMSQQEQDAQVEGSSRAEEDALRCDYETASSRLKGLMKKSKLQNHNSVPYHRQPGQERTPESPHAMQSTAPPAASDSCAARLKAVANLVKIRSSPTPSPKPSVACSQLALLLSSEAHLQQYSREQALKAQLSARSASERLAAMATQKTHDKKLPNVDLPQMAPEMLSSFNAQKGTLLPPALDSSKQSSTLIAGQSSSGGSPRTPYSFKEKRPFEKHNTRPSQNCSSLLLLLLNNHNPQKPINGSGHLDEDFSVFPSRGSPLPSDSEYSNHENSVNKDSDAESSYSSYSPMDLSVKSRARGSVLVSSFSPLDKLTESLINKWKPETPGLQVIESRELKESPDIKSYHEVTLMQLLLGHKNNEKVNNTTDNPDLLYDITTKPNSTTAGRLTPTAVCKVTRRRSPPVGLTGISPHPLPMLSHGRDINGNSSPYSVYGSAHVQSSPLDLCKSKPCSGENVQEPAFSASKLLQNLAQCGLQITSPSPPPKAQMSPCKRHNLELQAEKPTTLLERLTAPIQCSRTPVLEASHVNCIPFPSESSPPASEIENLLERRTVLQLLLGTATHKERPYAKQNGTAAKGSLEKQPDKLPDGDTTSGPSLDIKIKTEPRMDDVSHSYEEAERCRIEDREAVPKDGLLSQLLKQQPRTFQVMAQMDLHARNMKEEPGEYSGPSVPKKRKLCMGLEDHLISDPFLQTVDRPTHQDATSSFSIPGTTEQRKPMSPPEAHAPIKRPQSTSPPQDGRDFNVLKRLLLSDNSLKDLSHPRTSTSPSVMLANCRANGNVMNKPGYRHELLSPQWNPGPLGVSPAKFRRAPPSIPGSSWGSHVAYQESSKLNLIPVKREREGPIQWLIRGEEKQDSGPDSPHLTQSNPILYYMLQKGYSHLHKEAREQSDAELCRIKVKEEPVADRGGC